MIYLRKRAQSQLAVSVSLIAVFLVASLVLGVSDSQAVAKGYPDWKGEYFATAKVSGRPVLVRNDAKIGFDWGAGAPAAGVPADNFSVRWTREAHFAEEIYRFCAKADDGVRVEVDDKKPFIREWHDGGGTYCADIKMTKGLHKVRVEYYEHLGQAKIQFWWEKVSWKGEYFSNRKLKGQPTLVRSDAKVDFGWGTGAPTAGLPADDFSVRWTRKMYFAGGTYRFCVDADDGVRVEMDDKAPFIREWHDGVGTTCTDRQVTEGIHKVRVEYYEHVGRAKIHFWWQKLN